MKFDDLAFLTKFMTQFKKIRNVDMGETKIEQKELSDLTKAIQHNPYIQDFKLNEKSMNQKTKELMKTELQKNREIQKYGSLSATQVGSENVASVK